LLEKLIEQIAPNPKDSRMQRTRKAFASVRKEKEIRTIYEALESYKTTITLFCHYSPSVSAEEVSEHFTPAGLPVCESDNPDD
jgi:hypothetical protein